MTIRKDAILWISGVALASFLLAACRTASPTPKLQPTPSSTITATPTAIPLPTSAPTPAAPPSTPAPAAASTPTPTLTAPQATVRATPSPSPTGPPATVTTAPTIKPDPVAGEKTFYAVGCIGCHTVQGVGGKIGPDLTDIAKRQDIAYIRESEVNPKVFIVPGYPPVMPSAAEMGLTNQDVENIIAWFQSLK